MSLLSCLILGGTGYRKQRTALKRRLTEALDNAEDRLLIFKLVRDGVANDDVSGECEQNLSNI